MLSLFGLFVNDLCCGQLRLKLICRLYEQTLIIVTDQPVDRAASWL